MPQVVACDPKQTVVIREHKLPAFEPHHVRVKTICSYISAGTELTSLQLGANPNVKVSVGTNPLGYSLAGEVIEVGDDVTHVNVGDRVACIGAGAHHATEVIVAKNLVTRIPDNVSSEAAAPAAMMCFPLEGVRKAKLEFGENALVVGAGLMGQYASQYALASGARVFLTDLNEHRLAKAVPGVQTFVGDDDGWQALRDETAPVGIEAALFCLGGDATPVFERVMAVMNRSPEGIHQGRIVFPGGANVTVPFASRSGNIQLLSSAKAGPGYRDDAYEAGADYPIGYVKWPVKRNVEVIMRALSRGQIVTEPLITHRYPYQDALQAYHKLAERNTDALAVLLTY